MCSFYTFQKGVILGQFLAILYMGVSNGGEGGTIVNVSSMAGHAKLAGNFPFNLAKEEIVQEFYLPKINYYNRALVGLSMCTDNRLSKLFNNM